MIELTKYARDFNNLDSAVYTIADRIGFVYESGENLTADTCYRPDSSIKAKSTFQYDAKGNMAAETEYSGEGRVTYSAGYKYDKRGNLVEESGVEKDRPFKNMYKFDRKGIKRSGSFSTRSMSRRLLEKYIYGKYSIQTKPESPDSGVQAEYIQPDTSEAHVLNEDLFQFLGCRIIASDGAYLGLVWADTSHPHSIVNPWGQYGFEGSPTSIFNPNCPVRRIEGSVQSVQQKLSKSAFLVSRRKICILP